MNRSEIPPQALESELAVLGSMMMKTYAVEKALAILRPGDFYLTQNQILFDAISQIHQAGQPADMITLHQWLEDHNKLDAGGGLPYLSSLLTATPSAANVEYYARIVLEKSGKRRIRAEMESISALCVNGRTTDEILEKAQGALSSIASRVHAPNQGFNTGLARASDIPVGVEPSGYWFGVYPGAVTLLIGETGAGKSSLLYNISIHAARNEPLWGVDFGSNEPLRVLYVDPENAGNWAEGRGGVCAARLDRIDAGRPKDLIFHDGRQVDGSGNSSMLDLSRPPTMKSFLDLLTSEQIQLCILDPIANLFATEDENSNAEAAKQMKALNLLSRETGAAVVCCHHTGKDSSGNYGRGASARLASADVGVVFRSRSLTDEEGDDDFTGQKRERNDLCRLQVIKNRLSGKGSLYLKMAGQDRFDRVEFKEWRDARPKREPDQADRQTREERAQEEIQTLLLDGAIRSREEIRSAMQKEAIGRVTTDTALKALAESGVLNEITGARGALFYALNTSTTQQ